MAKEKKDVSFEDVITFIHTCEDTDVLKRIDKVLSGQNVYVVNVIGFKEGF